MRRYVSVIASDKGFMGLMLILPAVLGVVSIVIPADFAGLLGTVAAITAAVNPDDGTDEVRPKRGLPIPDERERVELPDEP